ncbi:unnamed protein product [Aphanomyces euteiches]
MRWKKLVVRDLPHELACEEALALCGFPVTYTESVLRTPIFPSTFFRWEGGRPAKNGRALVPSRLYLQFRKDPDQLEETLGALHGKEVTLSNGSSIVLSVHVAPNQKLPREKRRRDNKVNSVAKDPDFLAFLDAINEENKLPAVNPNVADVEDKSKEKPMSALVKFLNERRVDRKGKFGRGFPAERKKKEGKAKPPKEKRTKAPKDDDKPPKERGSKKSKDKRRGGGGGTTNPAAPAYPMEPIMDMHSTSMLLMHPSTAPMMQPGILRIMPKSIGDAQPPLPPHPPLPMMPPPLPMENGGMSMRYDDEGGRGNGGRGGGRGRGNGNRAKKDRRQDGENNRSGGGGRGSGGKKKAYVAKQSGAGDGQPPPPPLPPPMS